ncbi:MAG: phosphotransferase family protein [Hyphomonadaceae bacterium]|nr:phosphotransferase family protein [Hyphomonadaceae bacterium]
MIDVAKLENALRRMQGFEALVACERLSAGASRETYRLGVRLDGRQQVMALRRAPHDGRSALGMGPGLDVEAKLFAAATEAGVPGPRVFMMLEPGDGLGTGIVMEWIDGETLGAKIARAPELETTRGMLARQSGEILARLHRADVAASGLDRILESFDAEHSVRKTHASYLEFETPQPMIDFTAMWLLKNLPKQRPLTLVHSDFRNGNFIVQPGKGIAAVLDWELAHIGDPMRDLGWLVTRSWRFGVPGKPVGGFGELDDLIAGYESVSGEAVDRDAVRFWEIFGSFWWAVGCLSMAASYRDGSETSVERPAIGRRSSECQIDCVNLIIPGAVRKPQPALQTLSTTELPRSDELLKGVRDFLRNEASAGLEGRNQFLARVAANSVDIALRELTFGADAAGWETQALRALLGAPGDVSELRDSLCKAIRLGEIDIGRADLHAYLRDSVLAQAMVDQPSYPGVAECLGHG